MILKPEALWKPEARHCGLVVKSGRLWATRSGDAVDVVVETGDTLILKGKGWLVQALGGVPCDFTTSTCLPTVRTPAIPSRSSSRKAG